MAQSKNAVLGSVDPAALGIVAGYFAGKAEDKMVQNPRAAHENGENNFSPELLYLINSLAKANFLPGTTIPGRILALCRAIIA